MKSQRQLRSVGAPSPGSGKERRRVLQPVFLSEPTRCLQAVAVLPTQFTPEAALRSEERLILAVLEDAVNCFQHYAFAREAKLRRLHDDARGWIYSDNRTWPFSFENICHTLDIAPAYLREGLEEWLAASALREGRARRPRARGASEPCTTASSRAARVGA